jgi:tRNA dimethylallyltransferase
MVEEVRSLLERDLSPEQLKHYGLEYRHVTEYVCGEIDLETMIATLTRAIQKFAKRQRTWFRRMERQGVSIRWLEGRMPVEQHVREISLDFANFKAK